MNITEVLVPAQEIAWLPWAVQYFFYIGSAYAAAILFLIALIFKTHKPPIPFCPCACDGHRRDCWPISVNR